MAHSSPLAVSKRSDCYWRATFDNPPLNLIDPETLIALRELMSTLEAGPSRRARRAGHDQHRYHRRDL